MKLIFPNGEHEAVALGEGPIQIGSAAGSVVRLALPGVAGRHAEIGSRDGQVVLRSLDAVAPTVLNGKQIDSETVLKPGDLVLFGRIGCRVAASDRAAPVAAPSPGKPESDESAESRTRVRMKLPGYVLRGVSGVTFGKTFTLQGNAVIGRQADCDIVVPTEEVSRHHARLQVTVEGVMVEDLGSANGTFINDKRIQNGLLKAGEELRLDTVRFLLAAPGAAARPAPTVSASASGANPAARGRWAMVAVVVIVVLLALGATLRALGHF